jgi:hypothetical protein
MAQIAIKFKGNQAISNPFLIQIKRDFPSTPILPQLSKQIPHQVFIQSYIPTDGKAIIYIDVSKQGEKKPFPKEI